MEAKSAKIEDIPQPHAFEFSAENMQRAREIISRYPAGRQRSAVMPLLALAQKQHENWLPKVAMDYIAALLEMQPMHVYEVATFYSMYNLRPMGKFHIQLCATTPCWLRGSDAIMKACEEYLGITVGHSTPDGMFTLSEVECLGACVNAPMCQITSDKTDGFYEDLTPENIVEVLAILSEGGQPPFGSLRPARQEVV
jgi:NADH-quinone oxidoreductase subunit E